MAIYRTINLSFWTDSKVDDDFTPEDKYFFLYLLTNPQTNICGCYEVSIKQISNQTGYNRDTVERLIQRFEDVHHVIEYSKTTKEMLVLNWHKYNWGKSPRLISAIESVARHIKSKKFRDYVFRMIDDLKNDKVSMPEYPEDAPDSSNNADADSESSKKTKEQVGMEIINAVWVYYPRKLNKGGITKKAKEAIADIGLDEMERAVKRYSEEVKDRESEYKMYGSTFFNGRYLDYLDSEWERSHPKAKPKKQEEDKYKDLDKVIVLLEDESNMEDYMADREKHKGQFIDNGYWMPKGG